MKKGLIYGLSTAILIAGLFVAIKSIPAAKADCFGCGGDNIVVTGGSSTVTTEVNVSSSQVSKSSNKVEINTDRKHKDNDYKKSSKRLPATGSDMLVMAGLAAFAFLVVFIGTKAPVKVK